jgi:hypothetical protein
MLKKEFIFLIFVVLLGAAVRLDLLWANNFVIDADEAIVGLMAKHISEGATIPTFYYGQHYMGSLEALCVAGLFEIFGISNIALKIVPFAFSLLFIVLIYALTKVSVNEGAARITALLCALPPSALLIWSSMARGGFIELMVIGVGSFLALAHWLYRDKNNLSLICLQGFLLGLGWWVNNQIIYFMLPTALVVFCRIVFYTDTSLSQRVKSVFRTGICGVLAWIVGGLPYWIYNIKNDWPSLGMFSPAQSKDILKHLLGLLTQALPIIFGGSRFWQTQDFYPASIRIVCLLYLGAFIALLILRRRQIKEVILLKFDSQKFPEILIIFILLCSAVFAVSSFGWLSHAPRYLLPMYVGILPLLGLVLNAQVRKSRVVGSFLIVIFLSINLLSTYFGGRAIPGEPIVYRGDRVAKDHTEIITWLEQNNVAWIRTNYWIGYRLAFETNEKTKFLLVHEPIETRIKSWPLEAGQFDVHSFPVVAVPSQAQYFREALQILNIKYKEEILSGYHVFHDLQFIRTSLAKVANSEINLTSNFNLEQISLAADGNIDTRWGSAKSQSPTMEVKALFSRPVKLGGIDYKLGSWSSDYPRALQIEFLLSDGSSQIYFGPKGYEALRFFMRLESELPLFFPTIEVVGVVLKQLSKDPVFDWSIAELEFFEQKP